MFMLKGKCFPPKIRSVSGDAVSRLRYEVARIDGLDPTGLVPVGESDGELVAKPREDYAPAEPPPEAAGQARGARIAAFSTPSDSPSGPAGWGLEYIKSVLNRETIVFTDGTSP
jgi:hypothetical protein